MQKLITLIMYILWIVTIIMILVTTFTSFKYEDLNIITLSLFVFVCINSVLVVTRGK